MYILHMAKVRRQQQQKQAWYIQKVKNKEVAENSANAEGGKIQSPRKGESHHDMFPPCSRASSGGRTSKETN